ncbi:hypothetical protein BGK67_34735 (plasmid) [Streptomyces subrutilus]|uniref:Uncharacterized protein n=2 Tax=Streptomyces subrutilus TaxID=36818 RepID=A0A1E5NXS5_9ACTN|nr:hypothetical protein BGK67_34735 [Streptomyces subrutilus]
MKALQDWRAAWTVHERAAQDAMGAAFPALNPTVAPTGCCDVQMRWESPGEGSGTACLDDHGRATIQFEDVPKEAVGQALAKVFGPGWFEEGSGGLAEAQPGKYCWEDDSTYAEYEIDIGKDGLAAVAISYVKIEDIVTILDALETALNEGRPI